VQVSLNEVEVMATKAACGAGRPWGLAQEAGWATARLEAMGLPGAQSLLGLLKATDGMEMDALTPVTRGAVWAAADAPACPVVTGAYLADRGEVRDGVIISALYHPVLVLPFLQRVAGGAELQWQGGSLAGGADGVRVECEPGVNIVQEVRLHRHSDGACGDMDAGSGAVDIDDEIWEALGAFAHRTYVPATEASRLKGAGAGLTDND
jgi:hypothetical protein